MVIDIRPQEEGVLVHLSREQAGLLMGFCGVVCGKGPLLEQVTRPLYAALGKAGIVEQQSHWTQRVELRW